MISDYQPGYIRLHRRLLSWRWYKTPSVRDVFIHLCLTANYADSAVEDVEVKRGQAVFSYNALSEWTGFTVKQCRSAIKKLDKTGEISVWTNHRFSVATINNYEIYQAENRANGGQTEGKRRATSKKEKEEKEYIKEKNYKKRKQSVYSAEGASFDLSKFEEGCAVE